MNDNKIYLNNLNNMLTRINKFEDLNQEKDNKIKELEDQINKYEGNIMSYPIYSIPNKSQKSRNENSYYINKKKISIGIQENMKLKLTLELSMKV